MVKVKSEPCRKVESEQYSDDAALGVSTGYKDSECGSSRTSSSPHSVRSVGYICASRKGKHGSGLRRHPQEFDGIVSRGAYKCNDAKFLITLKRRKGNLVSVILITSLNYATAVTRVTRTILITSVTS